MDFEKYKDHPLFIEGDKRQSEFRKEQAIKKRPFRLRNKVKSRKKRKRIYAEWDH